MIMKLLRSGGTTTNTKEVAIYGSDAHLDTLQQIKSEADRVATLIKIESARRV